MKLAVAGKAPMSESGQSRRSDGAPDTSGLPTIVLQKSFCRRRKFSEGRWRVIRVMICGISSPCAKFVGDFDSATETIQIIDLFALQVFVKKLDRCNFRLLQHYPYVNRHRRHRPARLKGANNESKPFIGSSHQHQRTVSIPLGNADNVCFAAVRSRIVCAHAIPPLGFGAVKCKISVPE